MQLSCIALSSILVLYFLLKTIRTIKLQLFRTHTKKLNFTVTGIFLLSWLSVFLFLPVKVTILADTHEVSSIYDTGKGCFDIVLAHSKESNTGIDKIEATEYHTLHDLCCYDDAKLNTNTDNTEVPVISYVLGDEISARLVLKATLYINNSLSPPLITLSIIRVTRLLI